MPKKIILLTLVLAACVGTKKLPQEGPLVIKTKFLLDSIESHSFQFNTLMFSGIGNYKDDKHNQFFRFRIRIVKDSVILIDITDPIIGAIQVARIALYPDSIFYANNLNNESFIGMVNTLQEKMRLDFDFYELQNLLSSNLGFPINDHKLYYRPGYYILANFPIDKGDTLIDASPEILSQLSFFSHSFRPGSQRRSIPGFGRTYIVDYDNYVNLGVSSFPEIIRVTFTQNSSRELKLIIEDLNINK